MLDEDEDQNYGVHAEETAHAFVERRRHRSSAPPVESRPATGPGAEWVLTCWGRPVATLRTWGDRTLVDATSPAYEELGALREMVWYRAEQLGYKIRLRTADELAARDRSGSGAGETYEVFIEDDEGYAAWVARHRDGYVINTRRPPDPSYLILHRASCGTVHGEPARGSTWTCGAYLKVCSDSLDAIRTWGRTEVEGELRACRLCG